MNIVFSDADNTVYTQANKTIVFYFNGEYSGVTRNDGGKKNTIFVYNDTKYILDNKSDSTQMALGAIDGYNCYTWLAGSASNSYVLNLARSEFVGTGHMLDASGFNIDTTVLRSDSSANLYIGYSGKWTGLTTSSIVASGMRGVITSFARNNFSWIDTKKFVGTIDIKYSTKDTYGFSIALNTLRLVVVPRPNLKLSIAQISNVPVNTKANTTATVTNMALNDAGLDISLSSWAPQDVSSNKILTPKLRTLMAINSGTVSLVTRAGTPDVANAASFVIPSVGNLLYGQVAMPVIVFNGRSTAGIVSSNLRATYSAFGSRSIQSPITELTAAVYSTDSTFNNNTFTNNFTANNSINFAGLPFVQYMTLDNSNNTLVLDTNARTKNATFVIVENLGSVAQTVRATALSGNSISNDSHTIAAGDEHVYQHTSANGWEYLYRRQII
jgi:hypothetical protein